MNRTSSTVAHKYSSWRILDKARHIVVALVGFAATTGCFEPPQSIHRKILRELRLPPPSPPFDLALEDFLDSTEPLELEQLVRLSEENLRLYPVRTPSLTVRLWIYSNRQDPQARQQLVSKAWSRLRKETRLGRSLDQVDAQLRETRIKYSDLRGLSSREFIREVSLRARLPEVALQAAGQRLHGGPCRRNFTDVRIGLPPTIPDVSDTASLAELFDGRWRHNESGIVEVSCSRAGIRGKVTTYELPGSSTKVELRPLPRPASAPASVTCHLLSWHSRELSSFEEVKAVAFDVAAQRKEELTIREITWWRYPRTTGWLVEGYGCSSYAGRQPSPTVIPGLANGKIYVVNVEDAPAGPPPSNWVADSFAMVKRAASRTHSDAPDMSLDYARAQEGTTGAWVFVAFADPDPTVSRPDKGYPYAVDRNLVVYSPRLQHE